MPAQNRAHLQRIAVALEERDYSVAIEPDHPMLIAGPDLLAAKDGQLFAFFCVKSDDQRIADSLLIRLALSRLALPRHTHCIFLFNRQHSAMIQAAGQHFHQLLPVEEAKLVARVAGTQEMQGRAGDISTDIQTSAFARFEVLYEASLSAETGVRRRAPLQLFDSLRNYPNFGVERPQRWIDADSASTSSPYQGALVFGPNMAVAPVAANGREAKRRRVKELALLLTRHSYILDRGVPYLKEPTVGLLLMDEVPVLLHDPLKVSRAAAFAGWTVAAADSPEQLIEQAQTLRQRLLA